MPPFLIKFLRFNSGALIGPCTFPHAVCCSGEWQTGAVTPAEVSAGYGNAIGTQLAGDTLLLSFQHPTAPSDSLIPIPSNFFVGAAVSAALGFDSVIVRPGTYPMEFASNPAFGAVHLPARFVAQPLPLYAPMLAWALGLGLPAIALVALRARRRRHANAGANIG